MTKQLSTTQVYRNQWMTLREDEVEFPDGKKGIFSVVEKADFAMIIPLFESQFYMVEQFRYPIGKQSLEFPQGAHEKNPEEDPTFLAQSELEEEIGYRAGSMSEIGYLYEAPGFSTQGVHIFLAQNLKKSEQKLESAELGLTVKKVPVTEFGHFVENGAITDAPTLSAFALLKLKNII